MPLAPTDGGIYKTHVDNEKWLLNERSINFGKAVGQTQNLE